MGIPGLGQIMNVADSFGLTNQVYALAVATGLLGLAIYILFSAVERRALRWHPSQRPGSA
jgi:ABC-type nitrate/sulfonate/bicarbonate transport system permease component